MGADLTLMARPIAIAARGRQTPQQFVADIRCRAQSSTWTAFIAGRQLAQHRRAGETTSWRPANLSLDHLKAAGLI